MCETEINENAVFICQKSPQTISNKDNTEFSASYIVSGGP